MRIIRRGAPRADLALGGKPRRLDKAEEKFFFKACSRHFEQDADRPELRRQALQIAPIPAGSRASCARVLRRYGAPFGNKPVSDDLGASQPRSLHARLADLSINVRGFLEMPFAISTFARAARLSLI